MEAAVAADKELIPGLLTDVALECLLRVSYKSHPQMQGVCRLWESLINSNEFYMERKRAKTTRPCVCVVQALPETKSEEKQGNAPPRYGLRLYDHRNSSWEAIPPIPEFSESLPLFSQCVAVDGKLFVIGGWNPSSYEVMKSVFWFDFSRQAWNRGRDMPVTRSFFACGAVDGNIVVAGGHDENKNALDTAESYSIELDEWVVLPNMSEARDECKGIVVDGKFMVVSGYGTEFQGDFNETAECLARGEWRRKEKFWMQGVCPNTISSVGKDAVFALKGNELMQFNWESSSWRRIESIPNSGTALVCGTADSDRLVVARRNAAGKLSNFVKTNDEWKIMGDGDDFGGMLQSVCSLEI